MGHIFISHVEEDAEAALFIANALEANGYRTWYYERDSVPGISHLVQTGNAVERGAAIVLIISADSLGSNQVTSEVVRGHECAKPFLPVRIGLTHVEFQTRQPEWRQAISATASIEMKQGTEDLALGRILAGLRSLGLVPNRGADSPPAIIPPGPAAVNETPLVTTRSPNDLQITESRMNLMDESTAPAGTLVRSGAGVDLPTWKAAVGGVSAVLLAILFFASGCWKLSEPFVWSQLLSEFQVPSQLALPFTLALGIGETFSAALIVVPRFRRWGSWLIGLMLVAFMVYIGFKYPQLAGKECSCFPLVKRTIGPGFFVGDGVMLVMALAAGFWSRRSEGVRAALVMLGAVAVFAGVSFGVNATRQSGLRAPDAVMVDGKAYSLRQGDIFVFFYDPECMHCDAAARRMSKLNWKDTRVVALPTRVPQFAAAFLHDTGLQAVTSLDVQTLRQTFKFVDPPYGVALKNGHQKAAIANFDESEPAKTLREIGFVE